MLHLTSVYTRHGGLTHLIALQPGSWRDQLQRSEWPI